MNKILVVEDSKSIREEICQILRFEDFEVISAENGAIGLQLANDELPNLIVSDISMPKLNGYQLLAELQKNSATERIPFIFLTAKAELSDLRQGMNFGADDYLIKPFNIEELIEVIKSKLKKQKIINDNIDKLRLKIGQSIPHEFLTPLNSILGFSSILMSSNEKPESEFVKKLSSRIFESGKRLHNLIENYILYTKLLRNSFFEKENEKNKNSPLIETKSIIDKTINEIVEEKGRINDLVLNVQNFNITINENDFIKILKEIIENAIKFSISGNKIEVKTYKENDNLTLDILNVGVGMSPNKLEEIGGFIQFNRDHLEQQGIGLGLSIVNLLAKKNNAEMIFESKLNDFFRVKINFPLI